MLGIPGNWVGPQPKFIPPTRWIFIKFTLCRPGLIAAPVGYFLFYEKKR